VTVSSDYLAYVLDQLSQLGGASSRRMFGGVGLYFDELFFGLISGDTRYYRTLPCRRGVVAPHGVVVLSKRGAARLASLLH
jgi:DNA transformation protein